MVSAVVEKDLSSHPHLKSDAVGSAVYSTATVSIRAPMFKYLSAIFKVTLSTLKIKIKYQKNKGKKDNIFFNLLLLKDSQH